MTIKEIARLSGVSSAAVSRYLNGGYVSEEKKQKIRKVIRETGYHPSAQARTLRTKRASLVGVVVPKINSESISRITEGIGQILSANGYQMLLASTDNKAEKEVEYLRLFEKYPVDGIILTGTFITGAHEKFLKSTKIPVVVIGQKTRYGNCIYHDDLSAGQQMGRYVGELLSEKKEPGKNAAYISVTREDQAVGADREDGFREGLEEKGFSLPAEYVKTAEFTTDSGYRAAKALLQEAGPFDVISCATDTIAAGAIRAVHESGNHDIVVTGFGDNQLLKAVTGGIPTVHFGYKTSGIQAAELLLNIIEQDEHLPVEIKLGVKLICPDR